jgi:membrane-bound lytic murein transglycosylase F
VKNGEFDSLIAKSAERLPYDHRIYKAQIFQESSFNPRAVSPAGAQGLAQVMPGTWEQYGAGDNPFDPQASLETGAIYMLYLYRQWSWPRPEMDRICLAMASYNGGLGNILAAQKLAGGATGYADIIARLPEVTGTHSEETINYVRKILGYYVQEVTGHG